MNLSEGKIKEAIENFHTAQDMLGHTYTLQMLLGKAYSQTENYAAAIEPYVRAYEITPRNKKGHIALFQAAFLSYQNRDYDGAARRFEQLLKHARGKILTDTKWHMAWIRYLKEDYVGAIRAFQELSKDRRLDKVDKEKLLYWQAMSKYRMGFSEEAQSIFKILAQEKRIGYYTIAAQARLAVIPDGPAFIAPKADNSVPQPDRAVNSAESENTNQSTTDSLAEPVQPETHTQEDEEQPQEQAEVDKQEEVTTLKEPKLALHFEKAKDIAELQVDDKWARLELREIEKRTRNISYLQLLMTEYAKVKEYNRSAYIADVVFARTREKEGFNGAAHYWQHAFPKAFESYILKSSEKFDIPSTLIWSVIRGESGYRVDIHSSAGALGLMQIIPKTGKKISENLNYPMFTKEMLLNPEINIQFGTWYLKRLNRIMGGYYPLVFASYNAGPHRVKGWLKEFGHLDIDEFIEHIPYFETRNYVKKIVRNYFIYNALYNKKNKSFDWLTKKFTIRFDGAKPAREDWDE
ncbi:MAG: transglycosylase SLT domain-containing protein [Oligoflexia bacterium]|nr:transglycosylase SLT domain-containing protein [Oligoflexia bacterium]